MPLYFFHRTGGEFMPDTEGTELPNPDAARTEAVVYAGETIRDRPNCVWDGQDLRVEVTNEAGILVCAIVVLGIDAQAARGGGVAPSRAT